MRRLKEVGIPWTEVSQIHLPLVRQTLRQQGMLAQISMTGTFYDIEKGLNPVKRAVIIIALLPDSTPEQIEAVRQSIPFNQLPEDLPIMYEFEDYAQVAQTGGLEPRIVRDVFQRAIPPS